MGKNFPAVEGVPIQDSLQKIYENPGDTSSIPQVQNNLVDIAALLQNRIHPDICADWRQEHAFRQDLLAYARKISDRVPDHVSVNADHIRNLTPGVLLDMTLQFKLQCADCLTENCEKRDRDYPVELVKEKELNRKKREEDKK